MRALVVSFLGIWLAIAAVAQDRPDAWRFSPKPIRDAVRATVEGQLDAFRAEKFDDAYAFAASGIRRQFTAPVFAALIKRGYRALMTHRRFDAGLVRDDRERRAQVIYTVFDADGVATSFRYTLVRENDRWLIDGVVASAPEKRTGI